MDDLPGLTAAEYDRILREQNERAVIRRAVELRRRASRAREIEPSKIAGVIGREMTVGDLGKQRLALHGVLIACAKLEYALRQYVDLCRAQ